ncbi:GIY-YIG nuclease family protein [Amycolatopsis vastitatis]|uniref:Bacteriophage T5 Orf172 DNA-binding domain-containing protein n=1 Tax=Amycolatopsis vastitatis TaxID=1905142 RepID=A0A229TFE2_9PSEU|nr:GIY-YIG nuclease family protein [Amycolatopsis vastitatis]OXM69624.1 hypothetical protein CF165_08940 [Amycolatopsis vastitatis]
MGVYFISGGGEYVEPVQIPAWLILSGVTPQALMLYSLHKVTILGQRYIDYDPKVPKTQDEYIAALHLSTIEELDAARLELIDIGAVEEVIETDPSGTNKRILKIHDFDTQTRQEHDRQRQLTEERRLDAGRNELPVQPPGYIYLIQDSVSKMVKIGYSANVTQRHKNLQGNNPNILVLLWHTPGDRALEDALHQLFAKRRVRGEWFDFGKLDAVKEVSLAAQKLQVSNVSVRQ